MFRTTAICALTISLLPIPAPSGAAGPPPSLEGRWVLVEQTYGKGKANLADPDRPLRLEFTRKEHGVAGRAWRGDSPERSWTWPAWVAGGRELAVEVRERIEDRSRGTIRVRYRVHPSEAEGAFLEVVESYRVGEEGGSLIGRVQVTFRTAGGERGSYTLHRRFERMP